MLTFQDAEPQDQESDEREGSDELERGKMEGALVDEPMESGEERDIHDVNGEDRAMLMR